MCDIYYFDFYVNFSTEYYGIHNIVISFYIYFESKEGWPYGEVSAIIDRFHWIREFGWLGKLGWYENAINSPWLYWYIQTSGFTENWILQDKK